LLAVIGPDWLTAQEPGSGKQLIARRDDLVKSEIAAALKREIPVIPILVAGTRFPDKSYLPPNIRKLPFHQGITLTHHNMDSEIHGLANRLGLTPRGVITQPVSASADPTQYLRW